MVAKPQREQPESPVTWLEGELRDTKARLHKVESELEQALKQVWSMGADIRKLTEALSVSGSAASTLASLREELRQLHGQMEKIRDRQSALANRIEETLRQRQAEMGRDRQDIGALAKQVEAMARSAGQGGGRMQALEDAIRHLEEDVAEERLAGQGLERNLEDLSTRGARTQEAAVHLDQEVARIAGEIEKLGKDDAALDERLALLAEPVRRYAERIDNLESVAAFPEETREMLKRAAFERDQLTHRMGLIEKMSGEVAERLQEFLQGIARLDQRTQTHGAELLSLNTEVQEQTNQTRAQLRRVLQLFLRHRRRQAETLAQEIKELSQGELHSGD